MLRTLASMLDDVVHVHVWSDGAPVPYDSWLLGAVFVRRRTCRCGLTDLSVSSRGVWSASEHCHTSIQAALAHERFLGLGSAYSRKALLAQAGQLQTPEQAYTAYTQVGQGTVSHHLRFETLMAILLGRCGALDELDEQQMRRLLAAAAQFARELDVVEVALYGQSPASLAADRFTQALERAALRMGAHTTAIERQTPHRRRLRLHLHRWRQIDIERVYSSELDSQVLVQIQRCSCGQAREVIRRELPIGSRVLQIRSLA
jgi:hypothetical protein